MEWKALQACMDGNDVGAGGKDAVTGKPYDMLQVAAVWRIENQTLWASSSSTATICISCSSARVRARARVCVCARLSLSPSFSLCRLATLLQFLYFTCTYADMHELNAPSITNHQPTNHHHHHHHHQPPTNHPPTKQPNNQ